MKNDIKVFGEFEGEYLGVAGDNYRIVVSGKDTNGNYAILDMLVPPGGGPVPHAHPNIQETFYVLEGELLYKTEAGKETVKAGGIVHIPTGGAIHCFKNVSDKTTRVLCTVVPAGLEGFFREFGEPTQPAEFLPVPEMTPELQEKLEKLNKKYGQTTYPPNYLD